MYFLFLRQLLDTRHKAVTEEKLRENVYLRDSGRHKALIRQCTEKRTEMKQGNGC